MANSLLVTSAILGIDCSIGAPADLQPAKEVQDIAHKLAEKSGSTLEIADDVATGSQGCRCLVYRCLDLHGEKTLTRQGPGRKLLPYQINDSLLEKDRQIETIVMHCSPAFHDKQTKMGKKLCDQFVSRRSKLRMTSSTASIPSSFKKAKIGFIPSKPSWRQRWAICSSLIICLNKIFIEGSFQRWSRLFYTQG